MKNIRNFVSFMAAGLMAAAATLAPGMARADGAVTNGPAYTILNRSGLTSSQAKFYYLGYGSIGGDFYVLMPDGSWKKAADGSPVADKSIWDTGWNPTGWNPQSNPNKGGPTGSGTVPCYELTATKTSGPKVNVPLWSGSGSNAIQAPSMRVYFFQVNYGSGFFNSTRNIPCQSDQSSSRTNGVFGSYFKVGSNKHSQYPFAYFSLTDANGQLSGASINPLLTNNKKTGYDALPPWSFVEIGSGPGSATIDTSQVDLIGFPINVTSKLKQGLPSNGSYPKWNQGVGFSFSDTGAVNMSSVLSSYNSFVKTLGSRGLTAYKQLTYKANKDTVLLNPGNYISFINKTAFKNHFLQITNSYIWKPGWTGDIYTGANVGKASPYVPSTTFRGKTVQLGKNSVPGYPGYTGRKALFAIQFTATVGPPIPASPGSPSGATLTAYVLSPSSYQTLCKANVIGYLPPPAAKANGGGSCSWMSPAYQIFATDGALNTPRSADPTSQFHLLSQTERQVWEPYGGVDNYNAVVSRLGFMISMAFNHGVAGGLQSPGGLCDQRQYDAVSKCWNDQRNWYPNPGTNQGLKSIYFNGDTTQNQFARWLHTAQINQTPMMTQPVNAIKSAGGVLMGMGYGFAADENPTPPNPSGTDAQTPSKYDGNVSLYPPDGCNYISIMPWGAGTSNATPVKPICEYDILN